MHNTDTTPLLLPADCCDGSDEPVGRCANRCKELGALALKSLEAEVAAAEAGVKAKQRYVEQATGIKAGWKQRLEQLEVEIAAAQKKTDAAAGELERMGRGAGGWSIVGSSRGRPRLRAAEGSAGSELERRRQQEEFDVGVAGVGGLLEKGTQGAHSWRWVVGIWAAACCAVLVSGAWALGVHRILHRRGRHTARLGRRRLGPRLV